MDAPVTDSLLCYADAALLLEVRPSTLRGWVQRRHIPHLRLGDRTVRFQRTELIAWLESHRVPVGEMAGFAASEETQKNT